MNVVILSVCEKELSLFPKEVLEDFFDAVALLRNGVVLAMPLSRTMSGIGSNIHELRFKDKDGIYRVFYVLKKKDAILYASRFPKKNAKGTKKKYRSYKKTHQEVVMKSKTYKNVGELAKSLGFPRERGVVAEIKAGLTKEIIGIVNKKGVTHREIAALSGVPRSAVTGIISGSLQKVSIERLIRILGVLGKTVELRLKKAA